MTTQPKTPPKAALRRLLLATSSLCVNFGRDESPYFPLCGFCHLER